MKNKNNLILNLDFSLNILNNLSNHTALLIISDIQTLLELPKQNVYV